MEKYDFPFVGGVAVLSIKIEGCFGFVDFSLWVAESTLGWGFRRRDSGFVRRGIPGMLGPVGRGMVLVALGFAIDGDIVAFR